MIWKLSNYHCVKSVRIWRFSGPYFPSFGLNTERCSVSLRIQFDSERIQTRKFRIRTLFTKCIKTKVISTSDVLISSILITWIWSCKISRLGFELFCLSVDVINTIVFATYYVRLKWYSLKCILVSLLVSVSLKKEFRIRFCLEPVA